MYLYVYNLNNSFVNVPQFFIKNWELLATELKNKPHTFKVSFEPYDNTHEWGIFIICFTYEKLSILIVLNEWVIKMYTI